MASIAGYNPTPGQQNAGQYAFVGPNYQKYGEQPGFVYDPYSDQYYKDPRAVKQQYQNQGLLPPDPKTPSLLEQAAPIAAVGGALYAGQALGKEVPSLLGLTGEGGGISGMFGSGGGGATSATGATGATPAFSFGGEAAAAESYASGAGLGAEPAAAGMFDLAGVGSAGNAILPIAGAVGAYDLFANDREGVRAPIQGALSGAAMGSYFGPTGAIVGGGIGLLGGVYKGYFDKPSIREQVKKRWGNLAESGDAQTKAYAQQYLQYLDSDQAKQDAQKDFGEMKANGMLKPEDIWGGHGMFKTFGSEWLGKYSEQQRREISQALINANLVDSKKGDIEITDATKAKEIASQILKGAPTQNQQQPPPIPRPIAQAQNQDQPTGMMEPGQAPPLQRPIAQAPGQPGINPKMQAGVSPGVPAPIDGMFTINGKPQQIKYPPLGGYR